MLPVKTSILIVAVIFIWGLTPPVGCMKSSNVAAVINAPPDNTLSPASPENDSVRSYLALGDSYTIGESVAEADRYPVQAVQMLRGTDHINCVAPDIIATTGWTTGNLLNALGNVNPAHTYQMVTLLIGVNNQFQGGSQTEYKDQFTLLVQQSIALAGNRPSHVLVLSIPDYSVTPFARGRNTAYIASQIDSFNMINNRVSLHFKVNYVDVTAESRKAATDLSLVAADGLHFSGKEYGIWARLMEPILKGMLK
jgi:lysophospholipase L1-like esterase